MWWEPARVSNWACLRARMSGLFKERERRFQQTTDRDGAPSAGEVDTIGAATVTVSPASRPRGHRVVVILRDVNLGDGREQVVRAVAVPQDREPAVGAVLEQLHDGPELEADELVAAVTKVIVIGPSA